MKYIFVNIGMQMFRGGGENFDTNMSLALRELGHSTELYSLLPLFKKAKFSDNDAFTHEKLIRSPWLYPMTSFFHQFSITRKLRGFRGVPRVFGQLIFELRVVFDLWKRKDKNVIVHTCALPLVGYLANKLLGIKTVVRMPGPMLNSYDVFFGLRSSFVVANGDAYKQIKQRYNPENLRFINVGVYDFQDVSRNKIDEYRAMVCPETCDVLLVFVGRLVDIKNVPLLLRGFREYIDNSDKSPYLLLIGDGPDYDKLVRLSDELALTNHVKFVGAIDKKELGVAYRAADLCMLTSKYDNFPNVLIEAMSCGTPCVATNVGGVSDIVADGVTGVLVNSDAPSAIEEAISGALLPGGIIRGKELSHRIKNEYSWKQSAIHLSDLE